ncbi:MAG: SoxR reducing system RseC family protein [Treponema sp.]|jgi:sigma-E factor negative regulatory protein RseC|nr:SoxR reducing system RseC family protein [Treponema sp.]
MTETGTIREIQGSTVTIARESDVACSGCADRECKAKSFSYSAENTPGLLLRPGQLVETKTAASSFRQSLAALLPPPLGFIAGYAATGLAFPACGEPPRAAAGALLFFAAAAVFYLIRRRYPPKIVRQVVRVVE